MANQPSDEIVWPPYPYKAVKSNPFSIISLDRGKFYFVSCFETDEEALKILGWLNKLNQGKPPMRRLYIRGEPA